MPQVNKASEKSWRRLYQEYWIGQLYMKCHYKEEAIELLNTAKTHAKIVYAENSEGQIQLTQQIDKLIQ